MLILALESSAKAASAALCRDGELLGQNFMCSGLTHSGTLLPMAKELLKNTGVALGDVDAVAVTRGPGSFTGIRIGVSTVKGLCWGAEKPAIGVSTLEAMAWNGVATPEGTLICGCMDARRDQVYNGLFLMEGGAPRRIAPDRALSLAELCEEVKKTQKAPFLVGDGALLCYNYLKQEGVACTLAPEPLRLQSAWGAAMAAAGKQPEDARDLQPVYLRLSQAERERQERMEHTKNKGDIS